MNCPYCGIELEKSAVTDMEECPRCVFEIDARRLLIGDIRDLGRPSRAELAGGQPALRSTVAALLDQQDKMLELAAAEQASFWRRVLATPGLGKPGIADYNASGPCSIPLPPDPHRPGDADRAEAALAGRPRPSGMSAVYGAHLRYEACVRRTSGEAGPCARPRERRLRPPPRPAPGVVNPQSETARFWHKNYCSCRRCVGEHGRSGPCAAPVPPPPVPHGPELDRRGARQALTAALADPNTVKRRVYCMRRLASDDTEVLCWADVPANATCMELEAIDTPDGDAAPIIAIDYEDRVFARDDGLGPRAWPAATYEQDDLRWTPSTGGLYELDDKIDGVPLRELIKRDELRRRREHRGHAGDTPAQRAAISAHWSAQLRAKVAASAERERCRVVVDVEVD
jgi:hypothetical protein